jgi:hypothetical protein
VAQATRRLDVDTRWLVDVGVQAAKDVLTVEEYLKRDGGLEDKRPLRVPAEELANRILK